MGTALDTDNMDLDEIRATTFKLKNEMGLMAKNFSRALEKSRKRKQEPFSKQSSGERDNDRTGKRVINNVMNVKVTVISNLSVPLPRERRSNALNAKVLVTLKLSAAVLIGNE
ncbi:unnamed protein product [Microthlaspi erraticum]|uniref:Uncharacterized protein n=1 Tax=Microthlaspi erraticum TaxID=1685480 RepID=A0A6D2JFQ1_9BRAS|nr:unnamed protein product [Microthlaspi erraticum]